MSDPALEDWKANSTAFDRVRAVVDTVSEPRSAAWVAAQAAVSENTARDHLRRLEELHVILAVEDGATTRYVPDPLHTRLESVRELLEARRLDELLALKAELQGRIEDWEAEFGVTSPAELRGLAAETRRAAETDAIRETANEWETTAYRLGVVEDAIERSESAGDHDVAPV